jgi:hypothetical protein
MRHSLYVLDAVFELALGTRSQIEKGPLKAPNLLQHVSHRTRPSFQMEKLLENVAWPPPHVPLPLRSAMYWVSALAGRGLPAAWGEQAKLAPLGTPPLPGQRIPQWPP